MDTRAKIIKALEDLLRIEDVHGCMLTGRQIGTFIPKTGVKLKNLALWKLIMDTTHDFFSISESFFKYGLTKIYYELRDYEAIMYFVTSGVALIVVIPALANRGLVEVEIENTKISIKEALKIK